MDIDDICENGILFETEKITQVVEKFRRAKIDALFTPIAILVKSSVPQE